MSREQATPGKNTSENKFFWLHDPSRNPLPLYEVTGHRTNDAWKAILQVICFARGTYRPEHVDALLRCDAAVRLQDRAAYRRF